MLARSGGIAACVLLLVSTSSALADTGHSSLSRLRRESPRVAERYEASLAAMDDGRYYEASRGLARVVERAPTFVPALRRRCDAERELGRFESAIALCRRAVEAAPTAGNLLALSHVLSLRGRVTDLERARELADGALAVAPDDPGALVQRIQIAGLVHDFDGAAGILARAEQYLEPAKASQAHVMLAHLGLDESRAREAAAHAKRAVELDPHAYEAYVVLARAALMTDDRDALRVAVPAMLRLAPNGAYTHYVAAALAFHEGRYDEAREHVQRARVLGMEPESCDELLAAIERRSPIVRGMLFPMGVAIAVGSTVFGALLFGGALLSFVTSRRLHRSGGDVARFEARGGRAVRRAYRRVLWACAAYGYVFLPLMGVLITGAVAASLKALLAAGSLQVELALVLLLVGAFFLFAAIEAAFLRPRERPPSEILDLDENPRLADVVRDVAASVGVRPVERVYVTPGTDLAIFDQGGIGTLLHGRAQRTLHLGVALLDGLDLEEFEVLVAREYGHLRRSGTAGGGLASSLDAALGSMEQALRESGAATCLNPAWILLRVCHRGLLFVSRGAMRLQEVCADRWAAQLYGARPLAEALRKVIVARARFEAHACATLDEIVETSRGLSNIYTYRTRRPPDESRIANTIERRWNADVRGAERSSLADRVARFSGIDLPAQRPHARPDGDAPAWTLFASREALETSMTDALREKLARSGIRVSDVDDGELPPEPRPAAVGE